MENIVFTISRADIEANLNRPLSDNDWSGLKEEAEDILDYYFWDELPRIINDLAQPTS